MEQLSYYVIFHIFLELFSEPKPALGRAEERVHVHQKLGRVRLGSDRLEEPGKKPPARANQKDKDVRQEAPADDARQREQRLQDRASFLRLVADQTERHRIVLELDVVADRLLGLLLDDFHLHRNTDWRKYHDDNGVT